MRRTGVATLCLAASAALCAAQAPPPSVGPTPPFVFLGAEDAFEGKTVKGLPYSATTETEILQTLADGNSISSRSTGFVARDSEGRTRREQSLAAIGALLARPDAPKLTVIQDPVARVTYLLEPVPKVARRLRWPEQGPPAPPFPPALGGGLPPGTGSTTSAPPEPLAGREIESLAAQGTRYTLVLPAGQVGNARPLTVVSERWYSSVLDLVLETRHADPRFGETHYRLLHVDRREPERALFEVPAGYSVEDQPPLLPRLPLPQQP